ncbi:MAG: alkane 1-monooxygenase [Cycloclasticus sp.]|nr:MAG: alkane 1-monooxygenase [Cycloclasticus sp.]
MTNVEKKANDLRYLLGTLMLSIGVIGFYLGGLWNWLGTVAFVFVVLLDVALPQDDKPRNLESTGLQSAVLYLQLPFIVALWLMFAQMLNAGLSSSAEIAGAIFSISFLSALGGLPPSHELMHRRGKFEQFYSSLYLTVFMLPMNDLGHVRGHHLKVATSEDSDTPRRGELVYTFAFRSLWGQFIDSIEMERDRLRRHKRPLLATTGRFFQSIVMVVIWLLLWFYIAGIQATPIFFLTIVIFFLVLGGFNYTQHYGLIRVVGEPIEPRHSWNQLKPLSRGLSFEISNHSEHHLVPTRFYTDLNPYPDAPQMPSIALCFIAAFIPPIWERYFVRPRLENWDKYYANDAEKLLAIEANKAAGWI